jgi:hypothetical protein
MKPLQHDLALWNFYSPDAGSFGERIDQARCDNVQIPSYGLSINNYIWKRYELQSYGKTPHIEFWIPLLDLSSINPGCNESQVNFKLITINICF